MKHLDLDLDSRAHHHGIKLAPFERSYFYQVTFTKCSKQWFCAKKKHWQISVGNANCVKRLCFLRGMGKVRLTPGVCHGDAVSRTDRGRCSAIGYLPPAVAGTEKSLFQGKVACPRGGGGMARGTPSRIGKGLGNLCGRLPNRCRLVKTSDDLHTKNVPVGPSHHLGSAVAPPMGG